MDISVIIVSYNVRHFLEQCILSVKKASKDISCEVFVVDNNSADGSCSMVRVEFPEVKLLMNHENRGFSAANNQALKLTQGRFILLLNPDTIVDEDTLKRCMDFMNDHPDAGIAGVKMIDGKGRYLPESKRGIPTPETAFYKMIGFSRLFPKSEKFNRYYLGNHDNNDTCMAEIISGAFMFMRREAFLKTGFLDEEFFMHGEDIDYCYRVLQQGYNNYYFPGTKIIHYKGESTRKEDLNVFIALHRAMIIFVRKHFSRGEFKDYILIIQAAIILRAVLSLTRRFIRRIFLPATDSIIIYLIFRLIASAWGPYKFGQGYLFPDTFPGVIMPVYTTILVLSVVFLSGYKMPAKTSNAISGLFAGTVIVLVFYALLPADMRFSRAIIILGGLAFFIAIPVWRFLISLIFPTISDNPFSKARRTIIVGDEENYLNLIKLISASANGNRIAGRVSIDKEDMKEEVLGNIGQIKEVIRINRIKEVIFTTGSMAAAQIIESMHLITDSNITIRIASAGEKYILGSRYVNPESELLTIGSTDLKNRISSWLRHLFR
ncbi:MAG: glycosyltransferase [Bacteroidota bacterium]